MLAREVGEGKYRDLAEVQEEFELRVAKAYTATEATHVSPIKPTPLTWDFSKGHTRAAIVWPQNNLHAAGRSWTSETGVNYDLTLTLSGHKPIKLIVSLFDVVSDEQEKNKIIRADVVAKERMTAQQVKAVLDGMGLSEKTKKEMENWPPKQPLDSRAAFEEPLADGGRLVIHLANWGKQTGERDSWYVSLEALWK